MLSDLLYLLFASVAIVWAMVILINAHINEYAPKRLVVLFSFVLMVAGLFSLVQVG